MDDENEAIQLLSDLKALNEYCGQILQEDNIQPDSLYTRKAYAYSLFIFGLSFSDGTVTLAEKGQARSLIPLLRGLQEAWINAIFVYSCKDNIWVYYLLLQDELRIKAKRDKLMADGKIEDIETYKRRSKEANKIISLINRRYRELPLIPSIITVRDRGLETRKLNLKQKCEIIDYYASLKPGTTGKRTTMANHYDVVYYHFSDTSHVSPSALNGLYKREADGTLSVDISGGSDRKYLATLLLNIYLYQYDLMKLYSRSISTSKRHIPDDIKAARRRMIASKLSKV